MGNPNEEKEVKPEREKITIASAKDFDVSHFCGSGPGGQARNKVASGVQIIHRESGAIGRASDSRSQFDNRCRAFERLTKTPQFKFWVAKKKFEIEHSQTVEEAVEAELTPDKIRSEIKDENGNWKEVPLSYFDSPEAKVEHTKPNVRLTTI